MFSLMFLVLILFILIFVYEYEENKYKNNKDFGIYYVVCFDNYSLMKEIIENFKYKDLFNNHYIFKIKYNGKKILLDAIFDKKLNVVSKNNFKKSCISYIIKYIKKNINPNKIDIIDKNPQGCYVFTSIELAQKQLLIFYQCKFIDILYNYSKISEIFPDDLIKILNVKGKNG